MAELVRLNAILVFCEGPHDVAFCRLVLKYCFGFSRIEWKFSDYPAPLNGLFKTMMQRHAAQDMAMDMAHKFFLPDKTLYREERKDLVLLFNTGGKSKTGNPKKFLEDFLPLLKQSQIFPGKAKTIIDNCRYLFLYDSDHQNPSQVFTWCRDEYSHIEEEPFIPEHFKAYTQDAQAASCKNNTFAAYVFSNPGQFGTLEDILLPMFESDPGNIVSQAREFVDRSFKWQTQHREINRRVAETAKRKKAIITTIGQREKPGSSMNVILDQGKLISEEIFKNNDNVKRFANFIAQFAALKLL